MSDAFVHALVLFGCVAVALAELLGTRATLACWTVFAAASFAHRPPRTRFSVRFSLCEKLCLVAIAAIVAAVLYTALIYPPNSADAMAYHLPRVVYWVQQRSVRFFPTPYLNQIMLQPFAEYLMLHTYVLSGGDRFVNLMQWLGMVGSLAAVYGIAKRGKVYAALFCATLPNGILQASGAKNDYVLACWLACTVLFLDRRKWWWAGLAAALAIGTKGTAYLFLLPFLLLFAPWRKLGIIAACVLALNAPQYIRNYQLSGSPLGFDSAQGDGKFRWRNDRFGWKPTVSNLLRDASEQVGGRSETWNRGVYDAVLSVHRALGIDPQDPSTTWPTARYEPPRNSNHEASANNRWHLLLLLIALIWADRRYAAALVAGFLAFCFYLKWQPFFVRLELPLFVLAAPLAGEFLARLRPPIAVAIALFLISGARLPALQNWTRPLQGPRIERSYFNDMQQFHNRDWYDRTVQETVASGCRIVGIDINQNQLEYPLQALLLSHDRSFRFVHVNVHNPSVRYSRIGDPSPCRVVTIP